jgi:uncharacterized Zn-binding protein involved in type VI secretion
VAACNEIKLPKPSNRPAFYWLILPPETREQRVLPANFDGASKMAGEIIRQGDKTSHGGTVIEGSPTDICHGKPIAYIGHKTSCPKCKGTYPIVEGAPVTSLYSKGVALAGMKTACGAVLVAGQFTDTVE